MAGFFQLLIIFFGVEYELVDWIRQRACAVHMHATQPYKKKSYAIYWMEIIDCDACTMQSEMGMKIKIQSIT